MTGWASFHPLTLFVYYVGAIVLVLLHLHPVFLTTALLFLIMHHWVQDRAQELKRWLLPFFIMSGLIAILNPFLSTRGAHILFYFRHNPVTLEGVVYGATFALSLLCVLVIFVSMNMVITANKWFYLFGRFVPQLTMLLLLALRFIPLLRRRIREIQSVQQLRGVSITVGSLKQRVKSGMLFLQVLLTWSLEEGLTTADAMKARGYGVGRRSTYFPYKMEVRDGVVCLALMGLFATCVGGYFDGYGVLAIYPELETIGLSIAEMGVLGAFLLFIALPLLIEGNESWRWRFSR